MPEPPKANEEETRLSEEEAGKVFERLEKITRDSSEFPSLRSTLRQNARNDDA